MSRNSEGLSQKTWWGFPPKRATLKCEFCGGKYKHSRYDRDVKRVVDICSNYPKCKQALSEPHCPVFREAQ